MALIAAALAAEGQSRLSPLETVERGYGRLVERLQALGAATRRLNEFAQPVCVAGTVVLIVGAPGVSGLAGFLAAYVRSQLSAVRRPAPIGQLRAGASGSRPTRKARRSASFRSSTRTMCGVSVRMMSV